MSKFSIGFYNTENFFDTQDDPEKNDNEYTPEGSRKWTEKRYANKVWKISSVIEKLGLEQTGEPPFMVGLAEIENASILQALIESEHLKTFDYNFIHFDSLDERGIDTAILYRKNLIQAISYEPIRLTYSDSDGSMDWTRDALYVKFTYQHQEMHTFVLHLPSRRDVDVNRNFRNQILSEIRKRIDEIFRNSTNPYIVLMGDLNGNPDDVDSSKLLKTTAHQPMQDFELFNPMLDLMNTKGSLQHEQNWILYDQLLFSKAFFENGNIRFESADVYDDISVQEWNERYKGQPFRTYVGKKYLGGYSDHFPVYAILNH